MSEPAPWVMNSSALIGQMTSLELTGAMISSGRVDIEMELIDKHGDTSPLVSKANIKSSGFQFSETKVRGVVRRLPGGRVPESKK